MTRLEELRSIMAKEAVDLVVLAPGAHLAWLMGFNPHGDERPLLACISLKHAGFLMPSLEAESARQHTDLPFYEWADAEGPTAAFEQMLSDFDLGNTGSVVLDETMRADHAALVQDRLLNAKRQFTETTVGALRMRKDETEYGLLKENAQIADRAMQAAWAAIRPDMTEQEIAEIARDAFRTEDATPLFSIIGAGRNGAFPHHQTGATRLAEGDSIVMDIGGIRDGYCSDITRMAVIGTPPEGYAEIHAIVDAAVEAALAAAKPGVKAHEVDDAAREVISTAGYGDYFNHRTGHGIGTQGHEPPYITGTSQTVLAPGMAFSIEPGIYLPERFGIRLEEIVILRDDGPEILSDLPRDLKVIG